MTEHRKRLNTIRAHLSSGALGQREVWEEWLAEAADEIDQLFWSKAALQTEIERLRGLDDTRNEADRIRAEQADQRWTAHVIEREDLKLALIKATAEIAQLKKIRDGTERREAEYLALIEQHATENERLKKTLQDNNNAHDVIYEQQLTEIRRLTLLDQIGKRQIELLEKRLDHYGPGGAGQAKAVID